MKTYFELINLLTSFGYHITISRNKDTVIVLIQYGHTGSKSVIDIPGHFSEEEQVRLIMDIPTHIDPTR
jgi:hypothetical protein